MNFFQRQVRDWLEVCFGSRIAKDKVERNHRFLEEALELVQSAGCTAEEAHQLVDYVFGRPVGEIKQEVGGVMNTLAALCLAHGLDMEECGNVELARCWSKVDQIREKQKNKPKHSPLPQRVNPDHLYDANNWEFTVTFGEHGILFDDMSPGDVMQVGCLKRMPMQWVTCVETLDGYRFEWFATEEQAKERAKTAHLPEEEEGADVPA